jgi:hypothetical protein
VSLQRALRKGRRILRLGFVAGSGVLLGSAAAPPSALAQGVPSLDAVERAADIGDTAEARGLLARWFESEAALDREADVGRARFLRARLAADMDSARVDYLWVAIRGDGRYGAASRMRLAQLYIAEGRLDRAEADLERLRADFPDSPLIASSWLWTGNVRSAAGDGAGACAAWERVVAAPARSVSADDRALVQRALEGCGEAPPAATTAGFTVQLGAFTSREAALDLRNRVVAQGTTARVLDPEDPDGLFRVRSGRFEGREGAARHAVRLGEAGFEGIVVPEDN